MLSLFQFYRAFLLLTREGLTNFLESPPETDDSKRTLELGGLGPPILSDVINMKIMQLNINKKFHSVGYTKY